MTHSITPPPELVQQWIEQGISRPPSTDYMTYFATQAARWGSDQELEACIEWLGDAPVVYNDNGDLHPGSYLRDARRSKPPSLKEQALDALGPEPLPETGPTGDTILNKGSIERHRCIRRALEQLDD